jgi:hypothetical protein
MDLDHLKQILDLVRSTIWPNSRRTRRTELKIRKDAPGAPAFPPPSRVIPAVPRQAAQPSDAIRATPPRRFRPTRRKKSSSRWSNRQSSAPSTVRRSWPRRRSWRSVVVKKGQCLHHRGDEVDERDRLEMTARSSTHVETGHPVQHGERLFAIRPTGL